MQRIVDRSPPPPPPPPTHSPSPAPFEVRMSHGLLGELFIFRGLLARFHNRFGPDNWRSGMRVAVGLPAPVTEPPFDFYLVRFLFEVLLIHCSGACAVSPFIRTQAM